MRDPPWKRLVEELQDQGYESIYLDRLRACLDVEQLIHREAIGIRRNDNLETTYPIGDVPLG